MSDSSLRPLDDDREKSPWTQPRFVAAAVVVALLVIMAVVLAVTRPTDDSESATPAPSPPPQAVDGTTAPETSSPAPAAGSSACGLAPGAQDVPRSTPFGTQWELVGTMAVPRTEAIGPGSPDSEVPSCFAHSPIGALYAAVNILALTTEPDLREPVIRNLAAAGPGREAALEQLVAEGTQRPSPTTIQVAGFTFLNYDNEAATIDLAVRVDTGVFAHIPLALRWEDGDWKVVLGPDGQISAGIQQIPDLTGYTPWSGA